MQYRLIHLIAGTMVAAGYCSLLISGTMSATLIAVVVTLLCLCSVTAIAYRDASRTSKNLLPKQGVVLGVGIILAILGAAIYFPKVNSLSIQHYNHAVANGWEDPYSFDRNEGIPYGNYGLTVVAGLILLLVSFIVLFAAEESRLTGFLPFFFACEIAALPLIGGTLNLLNFVLLM